MAGFRMHVSTSTVLGCCYAGALNLGYSVPLDTAVLSGAMCGFSGMLPDLDSDYGVPLRETMAFTAATVPMLLVNRFQAFALSPDSMVLAAVGMYLFVRFGVTKMIRKYTVHRGMFHSVPTMLIFAGLAFIICGGSPIDVRCYKSGGVLAGFMSHLVLDEIYAVEWKAGRWRLKKSFGTALKFWGDNHWSNFTTYAKLVIVAMLIVGEPSVMQRLEANNPQIASQINQFRNQVGSMNANAAPQNGGDLARGALNFFNNAVHNSGLKAPSGGEHPQFASAPQPFNAVPANSQPSQWQWPAAEQPYNGAQGQPTNYENTYDTAQRPSIPFPQ